MTPQDAKLALELIARVTIPASDEAIASVAQLRTGLHNIASGKLVVVKPAKGEPAEPQT